jgi:hypothetical protein
MEPTMELMEVTAWLLLEGLSGGFYKDIADCIFELVKNGWVACMPKDTWNPQVGNVSIYLEKGHELSPTKGKALVILDHGSGFTTPDLKRFLALGPKLNDVSAITGKGTHGGASQKRIGRLSALAVNLYCANLELQLAERAKHGFYVYTRTAPSGPVRKISFIPADIEARGLDLNFQIQPNSKELGSLRGIKGSFSAFVIPDPVVESEEEIRNMLMWKMPRKKDLCPKLTVGGKPVKIPDLLQSSHYITHTTKSGIECYIEKAEKDADEHRAGIMICDAGTGLPVASATSLHDKNFVFPFFLRSLTGVIFIHDTLSRQNSARNGLHPAYANKKNKDWRRICMELLPLCPQVQELLGADEQFNPKDGYAKVLAGVIEQLQNACGIPTFGEPPRPNPGGGNGGNGGGGGSHGGGKGYAVKIGDRAYKVRPMDQDENMLAEVYSENPDTIWVNLRRYGSMPKNPAKAGEHLLIALYEAAGRQLFSDNARDVSIFVAQRRKELDDIA